MEQFKINDLNGFINFIKEKFGIDLSIFAVNGRLLTGNIGIDFIKIQSTNPYNDQEKGVTVFPINLRGVLFTGVIKGSGQPELNYGRFIGELAEDFSVTEKELSKVEFFQYLLEKEMPYSRFVKYQEKFAFTDGVCSAITVSVENEVSDTFDVLSNYCDDGQDVTVKLGNKKMVIVKFLTDKTEYRSLGEFAQFIHRTVYEETGENVKIFIGGEVTSINQIYKSFRQTEDAERLSIIISAKGNIYSFNELSLIKMLEDISKDKLEEFLSLTVNQQAKEVIDDREMSETAEEFFASNLSINETARKMYLHRNTLSYRLDKIEKGTGLNIRKFSDAMTFKLIKILQKLTEK